MVVCFKTLIMKLNFFFLIFLIGNLSHAQNEYQVLYQLENLNQFWGVNSVNNSILDKKIKFPDDTDLIKLHLSLVEERLRQTTPESLSQSQKDNRYHCLNILNKYWKNSIFPINLYHQERTPYFIDHLGTACAVGHLINETGFEEVAIKISQENNYGYVMDLINEYDEIEIWAKNYGFTIEELAWIQPVYPICNEGCGMQIYATIGTPNIDYSTISFQWEPGGVQTQFFDNACVNTCYTVTAYDSLGVEIPAELISTFITGQAIMFDNQVCIWSDAIFAEIHTFHDSGDCNGVAIVDHENLDNSPFEYEWSFNSENILSSNNLCSGDYSVLITNAEGCDKTIDFTIDNIPLIKNCEPSCELELVALVLEGEPPYQYQWQDNLQTERIFSNACLGNTYTCQITDAFGNQIPEDKIMISFQNTAFTGNTITIPEAIQIETNTITTNDNGNCNGTTQLIPSGGDAPYDFVWVSEELSNNFVSNLCQGSYSYNVTDQNGCEFSDSLYIGSQELEVICDSICNHEITILAIGGDSSYQYQWSSGHTGTTITGLCSGETYSCVVTDSLGNEILDENLILFYQNLAFNGNSITLPSSEQINVTFTTTLDNGNCNGSATVIASNGTAPYDYSWQDQEQTTETVTGLCEGEYSVLVNDLNCTTIATVSVGTNVGIPVLSNNNIGFTVTPNPANEMITIVYPGNKQNINIAIYNSTGKKVISSPLNSNKKNIDINRLEPGLYFISLENENMFSNKSFIKK